MFKKQVKLSELNRQNINDIIDGNYIYKLNEIKWLVENEPP